MFAFLFLQKPNSIFLWLIFSVDLKQAVVVLRMKEQQTGSITQGNGRWHLACQPVTIRPAKANLKHLNKSQNRNTATSAVQKISQLIYLFCSRISSLSLHNLCSLFNLFTDNRCACWCFTACGFHQLSYKELHILPSISCLRTWGSLFCLSPPLPCHNKIPTALRVPQVEHLQSVEVEKMRSRRRESRGEGLCGKTEAESTVSG